MTSYAVTDYATAVAGSPEAVLALLETQIETITDTKTIRLLDVVRVGNDWQGLLMYDA